MSNSVPPNDGGEQSHGQPSAENTESVPVGPQTPQRPRPDRGSGGTAPGVSAGPSGDQPVEPPSDGWQRVDNPWQRAATSQAGPTDSSSGAPTPSFGRPPADWAPAGQPGPGGPAQQPGSQQSTFQQSSVQDSTFQDPTVQQSTFQQSGPQQSAARPGADQVGRFGFADPQPAGGSAALTADLKRRRSLIIAIIAGLIVLVLIAVLVTVLVQRRGSAASGAQADAVRGYLSAVADGDSQRALGYLADQPDNTDLLTDKVLAASDKIAPITGISVSDPEKGSNTVHAWYKIGDQRYQQQFTVQADGDSYALAGGTATADLSNLPKGLSYKLDGAKIKRKTVTIFPGSYRITADSLLFDLGKQATFVARAQDRLTVSLTPQLTSGGKRSVQKAIGDAIKDCLASTKLEAGCGLKLTGNGPGAFKVKEGSIKRSLSKEASRQLKHLQLITDDADPTLIRTTGISGNIRTVATCEKDKKKGKGKKTKECTLRGAGTSLDSPEVRVSGDDLKVEWF